MPGKGRSDGAGDFNILVDDDTKYQNRLKRSPFPNLAAFTLSGVTVLVILAGVCFEVSTLLNG